MPDHETRVSVQIIEWVKRDGLREIDLKHKNPLSGEREKVTYAIRNEEKFVPFWLEIEKYLNRLVGRYEGYTLYTDWRVLLDD